MFTSDSHLPAFRRRLCFALGAPLVLTAFACTSPTPGSEAGLKTTLSPQTDAGAKASKNAPERLADLEVFIKKDGDWTNRSVRQSAGGYGGRGPGAGGGGSKSEDEDEGGFRGGGELAIESPSVDSPGDGTLDRALGAVLGGDVSGGKEFESIGLKGSAGLRATSAAAPSRKKSKPRSRADSKVRRRPVPQADSPLKAGAKDDNKDFAAFVKFLLTWSDREETAGQVQTMDVRGRNFITVVDNHGAPIPAAKVEVRAAKDKRLLWTGTTYGDGQVPYYPRMAHPKEKGALAGGVRVTASHNGIEASTNWDEAAGVRVVVNTNKRLTQPVQLDVLFVLDTTGSMGDELSRIKASLAQMTEKLRGHGKEFDLRYGAVLYRDITDAYVTRTHPFTNDVAKFASALQGVSARGGGDGPESMNQGLYEGVARMQWRDGAAKVMFLIADAPPHMDYAQDIPYGTSAKIAVEKGIRIHSVAASGLPPFGSLAFRQVAQMARGKFIFIEYGGNVAASGKKHGVSGVKKSNNLDDILFEQVSDELANWGRKVSPQ